MADLGAGAKGAASGAAAGAVLGPWGAVAGGVIGGAIGLFSGGDASPAAPVPLVQTTNSGQLTGALDTVNGGLDQQQAFVNALQAQNGIGNQSQVYNQLQGVVNGTGPNPAQAQLAQATGANVANQAALMAGQRGAGANTGLIARQAAQQGAATQQAAIGQAATLQANQSLNALNSAGTIAGQQITNQANATNQYATNTIGEQQSLLNAAGQLNSTAVQQQAGINQQANNQADRNQATQGGLMSGLGAAATVLGKSGGKTDLSNTGSTGNTAGAGAAGGGATLGPSTGVGGETMSASALAHGGQVQGPRSAVGRHLKGMSPAQQPTAMAHGGKVPVMLSPGEAYIPPSKLPQGKAKGGNVLATADKVPGKAKVKGDSLKNDTVPTELEPGGIVIPRSVMNSKNPHKAAADFVAAVLAKKKHS